MKTTPAAQYLNQYLETRISHPSIFGSVNDLVGEVDAVEKTLGERYPTLRESPFVTAVHVIAPGQVSVDKELDSFRLFNTCLAYLSVLPVDEIAPKSIAVFTALAKNAESDIDKFRVANLLASAVIRADNLETTDREALRSACHEAAINLRPLGFFSREYEQAISKNVSRTHGADLVQLLGFSSDNIPSLRNLPANRKPAPAPEFV